ncbi:MULTISPECIES: GNAT family N-acetyltransferase [unclassified Actinomyces]|uniref:GNAT family N-acetyltransferase n=1 Tax=unclassified Actinomyces TaxID=2609248 RepID=UPI000D5A1C7B|nr:MULTISPECIES: GNAT family N-acetyltransferase [unclassified Actinomyces]RAX19620.1 GNAT family N-acetyltransferase [Actinomyces sp. Z5]RAX23084.1 GNAT family N-acetyltransferase [Actinomyces sp. Z3]
MGIEIEQVGIARIDELLAWRMEVLREVFGTALDAAPTRLERANRAYYERELPTGGHIACLAWLDGEPVGCGGVCLHTEMPSPDNPSGRCAYLMNVYTRPAFQGRGVGAAVVDWLVRQARARGAGKVYLEASDAGRRLYESTGFTDMADMMRLTQGGRTRPE